MGIGDNSPQKGYCMYVHQNPDNLKMYIGISSNVKARWSRKAESYKRCPKIYAAFKKYGWNYFTHLVLFDGMTKEEACKKERSWICAAKLADKSYNITDGGEGTCGVKHSEERRKQISKHLTGRPCSTETRQKISESNKGKKVKAVFAFDIYTRKLFRRYSSIREAAKIHNLRHANITRAAKGKTPSAGGYIWSYYPYITVNDETLNKIRDNRVYCYDLEGRHIKTYRTAVEAAKAVEGASCPIGECCSKNRLYYKGFIWRRTLCEIEQEVITEIKRRRHEIN